ncbi:hypothetical protein AWRIB422_471 [Oenococcus oeni AWRIB422]|nr:hypothetical protein AWRIB422_471 [Oenococcus oeni AWRIB422]
MKTLTLQKNGMKINAGNGYLTNKILKKIPPGRCLSGRAHTLESRFFKNAEIKNFFVVI